MNVASARKQIRAPRPAKHLVAIAASSGGLSVLHDVLGALPPDFPAAIAVVLHRAPRLAGRRDPLVAILRTWTSLRVEEATAGTRPLEGTVYVAPADFHLLLSADQRFGVVDGVRIRGVRSSANPLFESAAKAYGANTVGLVLSGGDHDATDGVQSVTSAGGTVVVQAPSSCHRPSMPASAIATGAVQHILPIDEIAGALQRLVSEQR